MNPSFLLAVLIAAVLNMIVGTLWYMPITFGNIWKKEVGLKKSQMKPANMISATIASFFSYLVTAYVLFLMPNIFSGSFGIMILYIMVIWIAFVAVIRLSHYAYEQRSARLFWITTLHDLVGLLVMGIFYWYWK